MYGCGYGYRYGYGYGCGYGCWGCFYGQLNAPFNFWATNALTDQPLRAFITVSASCRYQATLILGVGRNNRRFPRRILGGRNRWCHNKWFPRRIQLNSARRFWFPIRRLSRARPVGEFNWIRRGDFRFPIRRLSRAQPIGEFNGNLARWFRFLIPIPMPVVQPGRVPFHLGFDLNL